MKESDTLKRWPGEKQAGVFANRGGGIAAIVAPVYGVLHCSPRGDRQERILPCIRYRQNKMRGMMGC